MNSPISLILILKLVAMATSLERSEKRGQRGNLESNILPTIWWKFGKNRSSVL